MSRYAPTDFGGGKSLKEGGDEESGSAGSTSGTRGNSGEQDGGELERERSKDE